MDKDLKPYIGCKIIGAKPMNDEDFAAHKKERGSKATIVTNSVREGYLVVYEDGYESWSPKDTFERAYRLVTKQEAGLISLMKPDHMVQNSRIVNIIFDNKIEEVIVSKQALPFISATEEYNTIAKERLGTLEEVGFLERGDYMVRVFVDPELDGVVVCKFMAGYKRGNVIFHHVSQDHSLFWKEKQSIYDAVLALNVTEIVVSIHVDAFLQDSRLYNNVPQQTNIIDTISVMGTMFNAKGETMKIYVDPELPFSDTSIYAYVGDKRGATLMTICMDNLV